MTPERLKSRLKGVPPAVGPSQAQGRLYADETPSTEVDDQPTAPQARIPFAGLFNRHDGRSLGQFGLPVSARLKSQARGHGAQRLDVGLHFARRR